MSITIRKMLHFFNKLSDIKKAFEKVTHFTPLHPTQAELSRWPISPHVTPLPPQR